MTNPLRTMGSEHALKIESVVWTSPGQPTMTIHNNASDQGAACVLVLFTIFDQQNGQGNVLGLGQFVFGPIPASATVTKQADSDVPPIGSIHLKEIEQCSGVGNSVLPL